MDQGLKVADRFRELVGRSPEGVWQAPGRVNLIGEHTDYNDGLALPFAIDRRTEVAIGRRPDRRVRAWSLSFPTVEAVATDVGALIPGADTGWAAYPFGVLWALRDLGVGVGGVDMVIQSTVPLGSGLSSSASLEAAVAVAVTDLAAADLDLVTLARVCHRAESDYVGAPTGLLDQLAVLGATAGHGLLIDFRSLHVESVPLEVGPLVVVDTGVRHANTDGAYAERRRACEDAATTMGIVSLRDATDESIALYLDGVLARRARHVMSEDARVIDMAGRLASGDEVGPLIDASHESLRTDFEVSCPELDTVVGTARSLGAKGARMTGAGFGGACIALGVDADRLAPAVVDAFAAAGYHRRPTTFTVSPSAGAGRTA